MADDSFEEPFDSARPSTTLSSTTTPSAPPSFAFGHASGSFGGGGGGVPPPAAAFASSMTAPGGIDDDDETIQAGGRSRSTEPSMGSSELNSRWRQYETPTLSSSMSYSDNSASVPVTSSTSTQPFTNRPSSRNYDTEELIRKYSGVAFGNSGTATAATGTISPRRSSPTFASPRSPADVRDQAMKMLELVDDYNVRRTETGGFRASFAPPQPDEEPAPFSFRRTTSGRRVPSALSGLNLKSSTQDTSGWKEQSGRISLSDPSFRDDDDMSDDEDIILRPGSGGSGTGGFQDEPVVDVVGMENRAAGMRAYADDKSFGGDFDGGSKAWSSRYSDNPYLSHALILDQWDREFEQDQNRRKSARNMFMSTASDIRTSAGNVLKEANNQKEKIFGAGGFSFRANHVFGNHRSASERNEASLRAAWREVDDTVTSSPTHRTWQEVMLSKKRRRRILYGLCAILGVIITVTTLMAIRRGRDSNLYPGYNIGEKLSFYVTSNTPFDEAAEGQLKKDLMNTPPDADFIIHLGNLQEAAITMCPKTTYSDAASILQKAPVPVFVLPGSEDWAKCPNPQHRMEKWIRTFGDFDSQFKHAIDVNRVREHPEAFAFVHKGVLFMGLHIVSGPVYEDEDWQDREKEMLKFYFGMANNLKGTFRYIVLLGNAKPSPQQQNFFDALLNNLNPYRGPLIYVHSNPEDTGNVVYNPFKDHPGVIVIGAQGGRSHPPVKITAGFGTRPMVIG